MQHIGPCSGTEKTPRGPKPDPKLPLPTADHASRSKTTPSVAHILRKYEAAEKRDGEMGERSGGGSAGRTSAQEREVQQNVQADSATESAVEPGVRTSTAECAAESAVEPGARICGI